METATPTQPKTLAQLKRDIGTGIVIEHTKREERRNAWSEREQRQKPAGDWQEMPMPEKMQGRRYVSHVQTNGFYLKREDDKSMRGSFCDYPKADNLQYTGDEFIIIERNQHGEAWQKRYYKIIRFN